MRVAVLGATGFIGAHLVTALLAEGHEVVGLGRRLDRSRNARPGVDWRQVDLNLALRMDDWIGLISDCDVIVNASGLLQSGGGDHVGRIQREAIEAMIEAAACTGIALFVQISAVGARANAATDFLVSKAQADARLAASGLNYVILRPGLVVGTNAYGGTALLRMIAAFPFARLTTRERAPIQTVVMTDLTEAVLRLISGAAVSGRSYDLVARDARTLDELVDLHRVWMGVKRPLAALPTRALLPLLSRVVDLLGLFGWRSPLRRNAIASLSEGIEGNHEETRELLGRPATNLDQWIETGPLSSSERRSALLGWLWPMALFALGLMWLLSGLGSLLNDQASLSMLGEAGLSHEWRRPALLVAASWDIVLAALLLWRRSVRLALLLIIITSAAYLLVASAMQPSLWLDPLAPLAKVLPSIALAAFARIMLEER